MKRFEYIRLFLNLKIKILLFIFLLSGIRRRPHIEWRKKKKKKEEEEIWSISKLNKSTQVKTKFSNFCC